MTTPDFDAWVVTVRPHHGSNRAPTDLKDIVRVLAHPARSTVWYSWGIDGFGEGIPDFEVADARAQKLPFKVMSWTKLLEVTNRTRQTFDGTLISLPAGFSPTSFEAVMRQLDFRHSDADLVIQCIDGFAFDVWTKSPDDVQRLIRGLPRASVENPELHF